MYRHSIAEAADYFGVSTDTIRRMISRRELAAVRIGPKLIRVDVESAKVQRLGAA